ncbi:cell wall surface anchor family protein [Streptococcus pneumoniae]|nr:cell wall surface anchor family protein [Streptococcus pneumoniae]
MKFNPNQRYTRWSIRRLSVGVASVVVASGFFVLVGQPSSVRADGLNPTQGQVLPEETSGTKEGDLSEKPGDTVLTQAKPEGVTGNTNSLPTPTERTEVSEETSPSSLDTLFEKDEEAQKNPELTDVLKETVDTADVDGTQASPAETTPEQVKGGVKENTKDSIDVPAAYLEKAEGKGPFTAGVNQVIPYELFAGDGMLTRLLLKASDNAPWSDNGTAKNPALPPLEGLTKGKYFYEVDLNGNTVGKQGQALIDQLRANGTQTYKATVKVYGNKDGKADLTNLVATKNVDININGLVAKETVEKAVKDNVKDSIDVPAAYLEKAKGEGPFTAGVNHVIPYELFAGDGMLTRLLLKASDKAPWSDNGDAKNPALSPLGENVKTKGQYFYQLALDGNVAGKEKQALIDQFRANGTQTYSATVNVYGNKDGKPDLDNIVATKKVTININGLISKETVQKAVADNVKDSIDVPAAYLEKAKGEGPFTAGVNHVIPYELFAGDGMLTRLLLKASDKAPWSDNGDAKNPALSPLGENVKTKGQYFYQLALDGNVAGKEKQALIDQFRANGTQTYSATVNVYGNKDGKPDLDNIVATKKVTININGLISKETVQKAVADNVKDSIDVPAAYLEKAKGEGPFTAGVNHVIPYELFAGDGMLTRLLLKASDKAPWSDNGDAKNPALSPLGENVKTKGQYFYQLALDGNVAGKEKQALIDQFRANGTQTYSATVNVYGNKDGKPDLDNIVATKKVTININGLISKETVDTADVDGTQASPAETTPEQVKGGVKENTKDSIDVPAAYLEKAEGKGPFTAGVNQVIPYELFAGDGMLTRLLLKASDNAPWSDNGTAKNPALPPLEGLTKGKYFYEVDLNGNTVGKQGQALIDQLRANGTQTYKATVKVYGNKDGKADLTNLVATKNVDININGLVAKETVEKAVKDNVKDSIDVPAAYLEKAKGEGPFTAGVNHVIPYELFAGDGMLTRLLLKASDKAPWSDNGDAKNPALSPLGENVKTKGQYFYQLALDGNVAGKEKQALIDQFRANGTQTYSATVNVYGNKDGKPDLDNIVATKKVTININGLISKETVQKAVADNVKDSIDVPAAYLEKAKGEGPFTAGVNHVIPYELFAGDGMLTRLLLKASDKAPWSDNGDAKNPALSPLGENVKTKGQYFYQLALDGNVAGKEKQALIDQFRANGTQTYSATVNVYGNKDGKPDLDNIVATKKVTIKINVKETSDTANGSLSPSNSGSGVTPMNHNHATGTTDSMPADTMTSSTNTMAGENMAASANKMSDTMMSEDKAMLPNTGETQTSMASIGFLGLALAGLLGGLGLKNKKEEN